MVLAGDGEEALARFSAENPDIILLDVMMPRLDGWQVCREIRKKSECPIIMITAKGETFDKVLGLELGADDYVVKPFETKEIVARIKAVMRRTGKNAAENDVKEVSYDKLVVNMTKYELKVDGKVVDTPPKELELLYHLASNPNRVYTRDQLLDEVWGFEYYGDSRTVDVAEVLARNETMNRSFVANVSHELKTPMTTIGGFVDGILDGTIPEEKHHQYLEVVSGEVKRLSRMVRSMLDLAKIEAGEMKLNPAEFDLNSTVCQVIFSFEQAIEAKRLDVIGLDVDKVMVSADPDLMHQVIYNLIDNAVKFVNEDGYIEVKYHSDGARTLVAIRNSGAGIAAQDLPNVFERFYKTDRSRSKDKTGVGLGLYIVRTVIRLHGGEIHVSSKEGEYTEFAFSIPSSGTKSSQNLFRKNG